MRVLPVLVIRAQADLLVQRGAGQLCCIYDEHRAPSVTVQLAQASAARLGQAGVATRCVRLPAIRLDHKVARAALSSATIEGATSVSAATRSAPARCSAASGMP